MTAPADFGDNILVCFLERLRAAYPQINVDLLLTDSYLDLVAEGIDVAIRAGILRDSSLIAKGVGLPAGHCSRARNISTAPRRRHHRVA